MANGFIIGKDKFKEEGGLEKIFYGFLLLFWFLFMAWKLYLYTGRGGEGWLKRWATRGRSCPRLPMIEVSLPCTVSFQLVAAPRGETVEARVSSLEEGLVVIERLPEGDIISRLEKGAQGRWELPCKEDEWTGVSALSETTGHRLTAEVRRVSAAAAGGLAERRWLRLASKEGSQRAAASYPLEHLYPSSPDDESCSVCLSRPARVALLPCRHLCLCSLCASLLHSSAACPICRAIPHSHFILE